MNVLEQVDESWKELLYKLINQDKKLQDLKDNVLPNIKYYPEKENIFNAFKIPRNKVKVVILGQDPYSTPGLAVGRAFAVAEGSKLPVSLANIKREIQKERAEGLLKESVIDINEQVGSIFSGSTPTEWETLEHLQNQGVLLLNTALTVEAGHPSSHLHYWENFIFNLIKHFSHDNRGIVWILWGNHAKNLGSQIISSINVNKYLEQDRDASIDQKLMQIPISIYSNYIVSSAHPAAEAYNGGRAGFFGNNHFYITNLILEKLGKSKIIW